MCNILNSDLWSLTEWGFKWLVPFNSSSSSTHWLAVSIMSIVFSSDIHYLSLQSHHSPNDGTLLTSVGRSSQNTTRFSRSSQKVTQKLYWSSNRCQSDVTLRLSASSTDSQSCFPDQYSIGSFCRDVWTGSWKSSQISSRLFSYFYFLLICFFYQLSNF